MAKDDKNARVKITVIQFESEGSNETLQEVVRTGVNTISRTLQPRVIQATPTPKQLTPGNSSEPTPEELLENDEEFIDAEATPVASAAKKPTRARRVTQVKVLNDIDLEAGDLPFKTFWEQKNPTNQSKRYLVIAAWLKEQRAIDEITGDHIYTCYRWLGLNTPRDITQPLRDMKTQGWFDSGSARGTYAINRIGMNEVNNMDKTE